MRLKISSSVTFYKQKKSFSLSTHSLRPNPPVKGEIKV
jgi:hypothetical protein